MKFIGLVIIFMFSCKGPDTSGKIVHHVEDSALLVFDKSATPQYINILISGQSNAWGASGPSSYDTAANERVLIWNHAQDVPGWVTAHINKRPFRTRGYNSPDGGGLYDFLNGSVNSAFYLARRVATENPGDTVRIVMAIGDGHKIDKWFRLSKEQYLDSIIHFSNASGIRKTDVFVWCQGEADSGTPEQSYFTAFDSIVSTLRRQPFFGPMTPIIVSGVPSAEEGAILKNSYADTFLRKIPRNDPWIEYAPVTGTVLNDDSIHYNDVSLKELGAYRYYSAWNRILKQLTSR